MSEVANLTMRQVSLIYYRDRDKRGVPKPIRSGRRKAKTADQERKEFFELGRAFGYKEEQLISQWESRNGNG
ncbi:hypothetical protein EBR03_08960 [bacterium]|nr:hypothetical protein [bacterium]